MLYAWEDGGLFCWCGAAAIAVDATDTADVAAATAVDVELIMLEIEKLM